MGNIASSAWNKNILESGLFNMLIDLAIEPCRGTTQLAEGLIGKCGSGSRSDPLPWHPLRRRDSNNSDDTTLLSMDVEACEVHRPTASLLFKGTVWQPSGQR